MEPLDTSADDPAAERSSDMTSRGRRLWIANGVVCSFLIGALDGSVASAAVWLTAVLARAYFGLPALERAAQGLSGVRKVYAEVALGWALVPGPIVGSFFGAVLPILWNLPVSSLQGALIGLLVGPVFAAIEGVVVVTLVASVVWLLSGRWLLWDRPPSRTISADWQERDLRQGEAESAEDFHDQEWEELPCP
jgi:hypothetical protein